MVNGQTEVSWHKDAVTKLEENIPRDVVKQRDGGGSKKLDYLEGWYVIDKLNQVFGNLNWSSELVSLDQVPETKLPTYRAKVRIIVNLGNGTIVYKDGIGWGGDKSDRTPHEMAIKEAETDALKRAAMKFGKSLGLALYDKTQEFVGDVEAPTRKATPAKAEQVALTDEHLLGKISTILKVVKGKKKLDDQAYKNYLTTTFKVDSVKNLDLTNQKAVLSYLEQLNA